jgi:hypothetical protein
MVQLVTINEYAEHRKSRGLAGGSHQAVRKAIESGRITLIDGKLDTAVADIQWDANTQKRADFHGARIPPPVPAGAATSKPADPSWADSKARTEAAIAGLKELELAERQGKLIDRERYERAAYGMGRVLRDALVTTFPTKHAPGLAAIVDPWILERELRNRLREALDTLATTKPEDLEGVEHDTGQ